MKKLAAVVALGFFSFGAYAQHSEVTPQSAADTKIEKAAVAKQAKMDMASTKEVKHSKNKKVAK